MSRGVWYMEGHVDLYGHLYGLYSFSHLPIGTFQLQNKSFDAPLKCKVEISVFIVAMKSF